jgi:spore germination protein YaaH
MIAAVALLALGGWIVPWQRDAGVASVERSKGQLGDVLIFAARLDGDGHPVLEGTAASWKSVVDRIHASGSLAWLTVVNDRAGSKPVQKDPDLVHRMIAEAGPRATHSGEIVALARSLGVDGVDIDYENLAGSERAAFTAFIERLADDARKAGLKLSVTLQQKRKETDASGQGAADWPRLCGLADRLQVMLYNQHNASSGPGPIASREWMAGIVDYALQSCNAAKVVPVLKVSGMDWSPGDAEWRSFEEVATTRAEHHPIVHRDHDSAVPWFVYHAAGGRHVVYFEDARSLGAKAEYLDSRGLKNVVLWSLGSEDPESISQLARGNQNR